MEYAPFGDGVAYAPGEALQIEGADVTLYAIYRIAVMAVTTGTSHMLIVLFDGTLWAWEIIRAANSESARARMC